MWLNFTFLRTELKASLESREQVTEIEPEVELWTPGKEDKLVAAWQFHECLFKITSQEKHEEKSMAGNYQ